MEINYIYNLKGRMIKTIDLCLQNETQKLILNDVKLTKIALQLLGSQEDFLCFHGKISNGQAQINLFKFLSFVLCFFPFLFLFSLVIYLFIYFNFVRSKPFQVSPLIIHCLFCYLERIILSWWCHHQNKIFHFQCTKE